MQARKTRSERVAEIPERTKAAIFLGTPHRGSKFTNLGRAAAWTLQPLGSNPSIFEGLAYDSLSLQDLHRDFIKSCRDDLYLLNFFEERKTRHFKAWLIQWDDYVSRCRRIPLEHVALTMGLDRSRAIGDL